MAERQCHAVLSREPVASWDARVRALRDVRRLAQEESIELGTNLSSYGRPLAIAVADLRSAVAREAFGCIENLAAAYGADFTRATCDVLLPALLKSSANYATFLASAAAHTAKYLIREGALGVSKRSVLLVANAVVGKVGDIRSPASRRSAALCLGFLLQDEVLLNLASAAVEAIEQAIFAGCTDSDGEARNISRENWRNLETLQPNTAAQFLDKLPSQTQYLIMTEKDATIAESLSLTPEKKITARTGKRALPLQEVVENTGPLRAPRRSSLATAVVPPVPTSPAKPISARTGPRRANLAQPSTGGVTNLPPKDCPKPPPAPRRLPHSAKLGSDFPAVKVLDLGAGRAREHAGSNPFAHRPPRRSILPMKVISSDEETSVATSLCDLTGYRGFKSTEEIGVTAVPPMKPPLPILSHTEVATEASLVSNESLLISSYDFTGFEKYPDHREHAEETEVTDRVNNHATPNTPPAQRHNSLRKARISFILGPNVSPRSATSIGSLQNVEAPNYLSSAGSCQIHSRRALFHLENIAH